MGATSLDSYQEKFQKQFAKISEANKASLAEYVAHRKVILELLKKVFSRMILENTVKRHIFITLYILCEERQMKLNIRPITCG